jgi:hypothetical protein
MRRVAHAVESKDVVRIEVAVSPRPCLGCAVELVLRVAPLRRGVPPREFVLFLKRPATRTNGHKSTHTAAAGAHSALPASLGVTQPPAANQRASRTSRAT